MTPVTTNRLVYPIQPEYYVHTPVLKELVNPQRYIRSMGEGQSLYGGDIEMVRTALEEAKKTGMLEPMSTLLSLIFNQDTTLINQRVENLARPYLDYLQALRSEIFSQVDFLVQIPRDNVWGDLLLRRGKLLLRSNGAYMQFEYSVEENLSPEPQAKKESPFVVFQKKPPIEAENLEDAVEQAHEPLLIESIVRVRSRQGYDIRQTILPLFGHKLIG